jgi:hypothetical protein
MLENQRNQRSRKVVISEALNILKKELKKDEGYFITWQSNISMAFYDEYYKKPEDGKEKLSHQEIHAIANNAAINFLNLLIKEPNENP